MNWALEEIERSKVWSFSILDDDFNVMAGDLCGDGREESDIDNIPKSATAVFKPVATLWQSLARHTSA
jgi:hypothetical protein